MGVWGFRARSRAAVWGYLGRCQVGALGCHQAAGSVCSTVGASGSRDHFPVAGWGCQARSRAEASGCQDRFREAGWGRPGRCQVAVLGYLGRCQVGVWGCHQGEERSFLKLRR